MSRDEIYMQRCLQLASVGLGNTYSNPMVGSVIVNNGKIIGEGFHHKSGEPHAEVNAVNSVKDKDLLLSSTLYVNLEPCAHYGKTPPCAKLIIDSKIPNVMIGCIDSFSEVAGKGIEMMEKEGINVKVGVLEQESLNLNARFFTFHNKKRPYVILKWAQTQDGLIDIDRTENNFGQPTWITNKHARQLVHKWRSEEQAILVGTETAIKDNPSLTVRDWSGKSPTRFLIDRTCRVSESHQILDRKHSTYIFTGKAQKATTNCKYITLDFSKNIIPQLLSEVYKLGLQSIIIEGGRQVLQSFIDANLWDEARVFIGDKWFIEGTPAPKLNLRPDEIKTVGNSELLYFTNSKL
ncbi:bifunctional diaminohydroxyphosphoribosylaminopyrimidine deaminase/5-amino-6-(5-phosphoribosylamino)uracil reductase RibD [Saccharicrinis aurantiacus]|uniref:bifunctional diaminohydroxyphosphoribosylaminopyrimidine deaminase/5-amino-6-(5-phosphoribosylamino)uracil reductase RibD n=1 Tax=Saccharicrinis aurantiacus TaxID=1849719 RepID=UPI00094F8868|nr:bifunctional diaminohydroxyphosphoribosylaminopyrimidine deaminase/5-amino-6-(5-phosphoribosylamino)uracil reductase RibD [Saccharicrinis aurantiacus]